MSPEVVLRASVTPFHDFCPTHRHPYPAASRSRRGNCASVALISCRDTASGLDASSQANSKGRRVMMLFTFQLATFKAPSDRYCGPLSKRVAHAIEMVDYPSRKRMSPQCANHSAIASRKASQVPFASTYRAAASPAPHRSRWCWVKSPGGRGRSGSEASIVARSAPCRSIRNPGDIGRLCSPPNPHRMNTR